jgi:Protein of unknown function (DUF3168)
MIEEAIYTRLTGFAGLFALIGTRVFANTVEQNDTYPAIFYQRISGARFHSLTGSSGLARPVFQFDILAKTYPEVKAVAEQVRLCLDGYQGTVSGVEINSALLLNDEDFYEEEVELHRVMLEYEFFHNEVQPTF